MQTTQRVDVKVKPGDIEKRFNQARKRYLAGDESAILGFIADFPDNRYALTMAASIENEGYEVNYREWLNDMNPLAGCAQ